MENGIRDLLDELHGAERTRLTHENAPALAAWVETTAKKFGLAHPPLVSCIHHPKVQAYGGFQIYSNGASAPVVHLTEGMLKRVFGSPDLAREVPDGLKFILGHEMGHAAEGVGRLKMQRYPLFAMPFLALIGYEMYSAARRRHRQDPSKDVHEHLDSVAEEEKQKSMAKDPHRYNFFDASMLEWGKRLAVMGGGLAAGGLVSRQMALASEFAADRAGVLACGNPQAGVDALNKTEKAMQAAFKDLEPKIKAWAEDLQRQSFAKQCSELFEAAKMVLIDPIKGLTFHAHPSHAARYKAISDFALERGMPPPVF